MFSRRVQPRSDSESSKVSTQEAAICEVASVSSAPQEGTAEVWLCSQQFLLNTRCSQQHRGDVASMEFCRLDGCCTLQVTDDAVNSVQEETRVSAAQEDTRKFAALTIKAGREVSIDAENVPTKADSKTPTFG